ncbi:MAG: tRNA lysidine(34) synthetase TilS [Actinobacteria bacterium]|nr:tRNA lysidine(34) synthetase TilS [Actinomycetota bacterium]
MDVAGRHVGIGRGEAEFGTSEQIRKIGQNVVGTELEKQLKDFIDDFVRSSVGPGPGGFASIPYKTGRVVRPLLDLSRDELRAHLIGEYNADSSSDAAVQLWREDATNEDIDRFRAFVRHEIVPRASQFNPRLLDTLCNTMNLIGEEDAMLDGWAAEEEERLVSREKDGTVSLDMREVSELEVPLRRRVLRRVILKLLPAHVRLDSFHIENIVENGARRGFVASLPATICVRNEYGRLTFRTAETTGERSEMLSDGAWIEIPGTLDLGQAGILRAVEYTGDIDMHDVPITHAYVDVGTAKRLWVTGVSAGDSMCPLGMGGKSKKISDILVDAKVPKRLRSQLAVVRNGRTVDDDIVWLVGSRMDERYKVSLHTSRIVLLTVEKHVD